MGVIFIPIVVYTVKYCILNMGDICEKKEAKDIFSKAKYDLEKIKVWIKNKIEEKNNKNVEIIYGEIQQKFNNLCKIIEKEEVIKLIKEQNFDKNKIFECIKLKLPNEEKEKKNPIPPNPNADELIKKLDKEFGDILTIIGENEFKKLIKELNYDENKIRDEIEKKLSE